MQYLKHYYVIDSAKMLQLEIGRELIQAAKHLNRMNKLTFTQSPINTSQKLSLNWMKNFNDTYSRVKTELQLLFKPNDK